MSEENKIDVKAEPVAPEPKKPELSDQELDVVAGGGYTPPKAGQIDKGGKSW